MLLVPTQGMTGAALALVLSTAAMFIFRTIIAQRFYRSIYSYFKTFVALVVAFMLSFASLYFNSNYQIVAILSIASLLFYLFYYRKEYKLIMGFVKQLLGKTEKH
jgi:O-antigen/teichoic acid export membrane protein